MIADSPNVSMAIRDGAGVFRVDFGVVSSSGAGDSGFPLGVLLVPRIILRRVLVERGFRVVMLFCVPMPFGVSFAFLMCIGHRGCGQVALHTGKATVMSARR